jgi:uncharacterized protein with PIN domain
MEAEALRQNQAMQNAKVVLCHRCGQTVLGGKHGDRCPNCNGVMHSLRNDTIIGELRERIMNSLSHRLGGLG